MRPKNMQTEPYYGTLLNCQRKDRNHSLQSEYDSIGEEQTKTATELAYAEVIGYNKKNLERELQNESRQHNRQQSRTKRREEEV